MTIDVERLPFLIEHGDLVWKLLAALAAGAAIASVRRNHARREHRAIAREVAACAARVTAPVEGIATVRGTLRGGRARSVSLLHLRGRKPYYDDRAPRLWLDCDGQKVALDGPIRVVRGSRLVTSRDRGGAASGDERALRSSPILHRLTAVFASVRDGDAVFATARFAARPGADPIHYREATTAWIATPPGSGDTDTDTGTGTGTGSAAAATAVSQRRRATSGQRRTASESGQPIELVAASPVMRAMPLGATRTLAAGLAAAAAMTAALWCAGAIALRTARSQSLALFPTELQRRLVPPAIAALDGLALAAATPGNRGDALGELEARFAHHYERTAATFDQWQRVARLRGGCGGELAARLAQDDIADLARLAHHCDDDGAAAGALQYLGRYRDAELRDRQLPLARRHIETMLAVGGEVGEWFAARRDEAAAHNPRSPGAAALDCVVRWFASRDDLRRSERARHSAVCRVLVALAAPEMERASDLQGAALDASEDRWVQGLAVDLAWAAGPAPDTTIHEGGPPPPVDIHRAIFETDDRRSVARALLSEPAQAHTRESPRGFGYYTTHAWSAARAALLGIHTPRWALRIASDDASDDANDGNATAAERARIDALGRALYRYGHGLEVALAVRNDLRLPALRPDHIPRTADLRFDPPITDPDALWTLYRAKYWTGLPGSELCDPPALGRTGSFDAVIERAAASGDGNELADRLAHCSLGGAPAIEAVFAVWPRIRNGRDRLTEVLRRIDLGPAAIDPLAVIARAAMRRDLAALTLDLRTAEDWQAIVDRQVAAFSDEADLTNLIVRELVRPRTD